MAKQGRSRGIHTAVVLPQGDLDKLKKSERGVSEEVRRRVAWTLENLFAADAETENFLVMAARIAEEVELETGAPWHKHQGSFDAFRAALWAQLVRKMPGGGVKFGDRPHQSGPGNDPTEIGMWIEWEVVQRRDKPREERERIRAAKEETFREIVKMHQQREAEENGQ